MSLDLKLLGTKLKKCREHLLIELDEVSTKTGINLARIKSIEDGGIEPLGDEILIFADFYKEDFHFFISNQQKSVSEQTDILYRSYTNIFTKEDRWAIREFLYLCECEQFIQDELGMKTIAFSYTLPNQFYKDYHKLEAAKASLALRKALGHESRDIIHDVYSDFRKIGLHIFRRRLSNKNFSGLFINHPYAGKCILVNYDEDLYRQNFTVAHEVAHAIFDVNAQINVSLGNDSNIDYKEIRANNFASNFLIPRDALKSLNINNWQDSHVLKTAEQLKVNPIALAIALKDAGLITSEGFEKLKHLKIPVSQKKDGELQRLSPKMLAAKTHILEKGLSTYYVKSAIKAYHENKLSLKRLSEILLTNEDGVEEIANFLNEKLHD